MTVRRKAATVGALAVAPLALSLMAAVPAAAHGSMDNPVSRISTCHQEGPENPQSDACKEMVAIGGTQPLYDWNEVNLANADGRHRDLIPDGTLCSAGRDKYAGLDQPRADWPATELSSGSHTFRYAASAPHTGSFELFITREGYDPTQPLRWADLESFGEVTDPPLEEGAYVFGMEIPEREGRHLIYSVWQRSDSPEAFYTCSDVVLGGDSGGSAAGAQPAGAPAAEPGTGADAAGPEDHGDHDEPGKDAGGGADDRGGAAKDPAESGPENLASPAGNEPAPQGATEEEPSLARTGGESTTVLLAAGGAAALTAGAGLVFTSLRRRAAARPRA
ncbi:lytic polysaccharide monooxygenase [Streptomyces sp. ACA25]|uniref:lytic polysaccharide monooxygenase auxiliary activity family 9 protein n=1 Tax=Streptomyces sp. ACA25 TaxID=3022596 RepID=UPI002308090E|nr:lytic polysaccharide monooxygenase [Streptomyces sp. ACA25]MDB1089096.1 lytic polysaccharide monooxygenase [Streptomyces sp. ACA25]